MHNNIAPLAIPDMKILNKNTTNDNTFRAFCKAIELELNEYPYYQYKEYPSDRSSGWIELFLNELETCFENLNSYIFCSSHSPTPYFIAYHINEWDYQCFGVKMAKSTLVFAPPTISQTSFTDFVKTVKLELKSIGVEFITTRINGDNLALINAHLSNQFSYMETIVWPVLQTSTLNFDSINSCEVLTENRELETVKSIARNDQYQRAHFHCDTRLQIERSNEMCARWVESSFKSDDFICVSRVNCEIVGYFICGVDLKLSKYLGTKYGRLKSLALKSSFRGQQLGTQLFIGTLRYLAENGCKYIDSGYATKNHTSAYLHTLTKFHSKYEEVTMHCWVDSRP